MLDAKSKAPKPGKTQGPDESTVGNHTTVARRAQEVFREKVLYQRWARFPVALLQADDLTFSMLKTLLALLSFSDRTGKAVFPSQSLLALAAGYGGKSPTRPVQRALDALEKASYIRRTWRYGKTGHFREYSFTQRVTNPALWVYGEGVTTTGTVREATEGGGDDHGGRVGDGPSGRVGDGPSGRVPLYEEKIEKKKEESNRTGVVAAPSQGTDGSDTPSQGWQATKDLIAETLGVKRTATKAKASQPESDPPDGLDDDEEAKALRNLLESKRAAQKGLEVSTLGGSL